MKAEYRAEVRQAHCAIVDAITAQDADAARAARAAAAEHMRCAARRLQDADAPIHQQPSGSTP